MDLSIKGVPEDQVSRLRERAKATIGRCRAN